MKYMENVENLNIQLLQIWLIVVKCFKRLEKVLSN